MILRKLDQTILAATGRADRRLSLRQRRRIDRRFARLEQALTEAKSEALAADLIRPLRRAVEIFRFSTVRLDLRENTTRTTKALQELWRVKTGGEAPPEPESAEWRAWLVQELAQPRTAPVSRDALSNDARDTIEMFEVVADLRARLDREAFGGFILSMTHCVDDVLGAYLLAKEAGLFLDEAGVEICTLPIVPLVRDHRRFARRARHHARTLQGSRRTAQHALAGQSARGDDRLFGLQQGRRLPAVELGTVSRRSRG